MRAGLGAARSLLVAGSILVAAHVTLLVFDPRALFLSNLFLLIYPLLGVTACLLSAYSECPQVKPPLWRLFGCGFPGRSRGPHFFVLACFFLGLLVCFSVAAVGQVNIYTRSYGNSRSGANLQETILTPTNVNSNRFGKLFTVPTDGQIYTQPLYVANLAIAGGTHNVVFVGSMFNTVYAIDADNGTVYWTQNFGSEIIAEDVQNDQNISWYTGVGILGTPVIDPNTNIMYFVSGSQPSNGAQVYAYYLNALEIATGNPVSGSPVNITATYSTPDLTTPLVFNPKTQNQRAGLALANGNIYLGFGSHNDILPYTGWVMAYSESTLAQVAVYATTTIGSEGGIWMSGQAPAIDSAGNLYFSTGNGSSGVTPNNLVQTGQSFIKLSPTLQLLDYFTPSNAATMSAGDMDLGSAGLLLLPNTTDVLGGGKQGILYLVNTNDMGGFHASGDNVIQEFQAIYGQGTSHIHGAPVYFNSDLNGPTTYVWGENDVLRGFEFNATSGLLNTTPFATGTMTAPVTNNDGAMPGGFTSISANGNSNGILWASTPFNGNAAGNSNPTFPGDGLVQGVLYAFDADTLSLLWTDKTNDARDEIGLFAKNVPPTVTNGRVYVSNFGLRFTSCANCGRGERHGEDGRCATHLDGNGLRAGEWRYARKDDCGHVQQRHGLQQFPGRYLSHHRDSDRFISRQLRGGGERGNTYHHAGSHSDRDGQQRGPGLGCGQPNLRRNGDRRTDRRRLYGNLRHHGDHHQRYGQLSHHAVRDGFKLDDLHRRHR
jgi:outer membrane protein assembly factor BamB